MSNAQNAGWSAAQCAAWYDQQPQVRDYKADVVDRALAATLPSSLGLVVYGQAWGDDLICVHPHEIDSAKPSLIITGGVHGYEPSGIEASLQLIEGAAADLAQQANLFIYPCVTPAAYRINHRWTVGAHDTNREFTESTTVPEAALLMGSVRGWSVQQFAAATDCHETPPADRQFRRLRAERYGTTLTGDPDLLPNGFHLMVPDTALLHKNVRDCARTIINAVAAITPIADDEKIVGNLNDGGIVPSTAEGTLTRWMNDRSRFATTIEVVTEGMSLQQATAIQLTAVRAAAGYALNFNA